MSNMRSSFGDFLTGIVVGGLVGYVIAILSAPRRGEETRQMLTERSRDLRDLAQEKVEQTGRLVAEKREQIEEQAVHAVDRARNQIDEVKHKKIEGKAEDVREQTSNKVRSAADEIDPHLAG